MSDSAKTPSKAKAPKKSPANAKPAAKKAAPKAKAQPAKKAAPKAKAQPAKPAPKAKAQPAVKKAAPKPPPKPKGPDIGELIAFAKAWAAADTEAHHVADTMERIGLAEKGKPADLIETFGQWLNFGTAGLRGVFGPGPNRMNRRMVRLTTAGLADYLLTTAEDVKRDGVVIGYDGRHFAREFAEDAARVLAGRGIKSFLAERVSPTPLIAHSVRALGAAAGIVVTASHNPPEYSGYKVYWDNGAQIIPPHDKGIAAAIQALSDYGDCPELHSVTPMFVRRIPPSVIAGYEKAVLGLRCAPATGAVVAYSAMHGVGTRILKRVFAAAGHELHAEASQAWPDPDFSTVRFPNPEEPGAMDRVMALGKEVGADIAIANDPDADRLCVAVRGEKGFYLLSGDQVGVLLASELMREGPDWAREPHQYATTVVSSSMLGAMAKKRGHDYAETLTGFKWIANNGLDFEARTGGQFVMGYEEALGYTVGGVARDKDGISAALLIADLASVLKAEGKSLQDRLNELYTEFGMYRTRQYAVRLPGADGAAKIRSAMDTVRANPPQSLAGKKVIAVRDLLTGNRTAGKKTSSIDLPRSNVLAFDLEGGSRMVVRPSGTEPKIKFYFQGCAPVGKDGMGAAEKAADAIVAALAADAKKLTGL